MPHTLRASATKSRSARHALAAVAATAGLLLAACGSDQTGERSPSYDPAPSSVESAAPSVGEDLRIPLQLEGTKVVDPNWETEPQHAHGVFLGAGRSGDVLEFSAVDSEGNILWQAERPVSCTGFTVSVQDGQAVAVLSDIQPGGEGLVTSATGYDLTTGEQLWEPVEVAGPHQGPGAIYAAPPTEQIGDLGPKVVIHPGTGEIVLDERQSDDVRMVGEFNGTLLVIQDETLKALILDEVATSGLETEPVWELDTTQQGWNPDRVFSPYAGALASDQAVLVGSAEDNLSLVSLADGKVLADGLTDAAQDPSSGTWIGLGELLMGVGADGERVFTAPGDGLELAGVGAAMGYFVNADGALQAHNVVTGQLGQAFDNDQTGEVAVPRLITTDNTAVLKTSTGYLLATPED